MTTKWLVATLCVGCLGVLPAALMERPRAGHAPKGNGRPARAADKVVNIVGPGAQAQYLEEGSSAPAPVQVTVGQTVRWRNRGNRVHTATSDRQADAQPVFDTDEIEPGGARDIVFDRALYARAGGVAGGSVRLPYHCTLHPSMTGEIILSDPRGVTGYNERLDLVRQDILSLPDAELKNLREAFRRLQDSGEYDNQVALHARYAEHYNSLIWPWHRAYLYYFEKKLQAAFPEANPPVTLPYWYYDAPPGDDEYRKLPEPFRKPTADGSPNPLYVRRFQGVNEGARALAYGSVRTDRILTITNYFSFAPALENGPHANVHNWVGQTMSNIRISPRDPIFWLHHANLDRVWDNWVRKAGHQNPTDPNWTRLPLRGFDSEPLHKVGDFLNITDLGYSYMQALIRVRLARDGKQGSYQARVDLGVARKYPASRILLQFTGVEIPRRGNLNGRVFLGLPKADAETPLADPHFVGEFTVLAASGAHRHGGQTVVVLDATAAVRALLGKEQPAVLPLTVALVPPQPGQAAAEGFHFRAARILVTD